MPPPSKRVTGDVHRYDPFGSSISTVSGLSEWMFDFAWLPFSPRGVAARHHVPSCHPVPCLSGSRLSRILGQQATFRCRVATNGSRSWRTITGRYFDELGVKGHDTCMRCAGGRAEPRSFSHLPPFTDQVRSSQAAHPISHQGRE